MLFCGGVLQSLPSPPLPSLREGQPIDLRPSGPASRERNESSSTTCPDPAVPPRLTGTLASGPSTRFIGISFGLAARPCLLAPVPVPNDDENSSPFQDLNPAHRACCIAGGCFPGVRKVAEPEPPRKSQLLKIQERRGEYTQASQIERCCVGASVATTEISANAGCRKITYTGNCATYLDRYQTPPRFQLHV